MRALILVLVVLLNFILQTTLLGAIAIMGVVPNTALLIVISYAMLRGDGPGALLGFFTGLLTDLLFAPFVGLNAFLYMMAGYLCGKPFKDFFPENYLFPLALTAVGVLGCEFCFYFFSFFFQGRVDIVRQFQSVILPEMVYTMLLCLPVYRLLYGLNEWLSEREGRRKSLF